MAMVDFFTDYFLPGWGMIMGVLIIILFIKGISYD